VTLKKGAAAAEVTLTRACGEVQKWAKGLVPAALTGEEKYAASSTI